MALPFSWLLLAAAAAHAEDWPQFRGPTGQGHSTEVGIPLDWSDTKNVAWKAPVPGTGWSSPVVSGGRVWVTATDAPIGNLSRPADTSLRLLAFDADTGRQLVDKEVFRIRHPVSISPKNSRASPTPIVEGDRVYVHFGMDGTASRRNMGPLPASGKWVRLEIPADRVGLAGKEINGLSFDQFDGHVLWGKAGVIHAAPPSKPILDMLWALVASPEFQYIR